MKKSIVKHHKSRQNQRKSMILLGTFLGLGLLALTLINNYYYQILTPSTINYISEEDPTLAKTATEKKIIEKVNSAAQKESRFKTNSNAHKTAVKELYVAGEMLSVARAVPNEKDLKKIENQAITNLKTGKFAIVGSSAGTSKVSGAKNTPILNEDESLRDEANLPVTRVSNPSSLSREVGSTIPQGGLPYSNNSQTEACKASPTSFGCAYPPGFVYTGDDKCGGSVAGYYCWKDAKDGVYKYYVVNLGPTMAEYNKRLEAANKSLANYTGDGSANSIATYLNSKGIYDDSSIKKLTAEIQKNLTPVPPADPNDVETAAEKAAREAKEKEEKIKQLTLANKSYTKDSCNSAIDSFKEDLKCISIQGGGYGVVPINSNITSVSYNTGTTAGRPSSLNKDYESESECKKNNLSPAEVCNPVTKGSQTVYRIVAKDTEERRKLMTFEFGSDPANSPADPATSNDNSAPDPEGLDSGGAMTTPGDGLTEPAWWTSFKNFFSPKTTTSADPSIQNQSGNIGGTVNNPSTCKYSGATIAGLGLYNCPNGPTGGLNTTPSKTTSQGTTNTQATPQTPEQVTIDNLQEKYLKIVTAKPDAFVGAKTYKGFWFPGWGAKSSCETEHPTGCIPVPGKKNQYVSKEDIEKYMNDLKL